ncbi:MAG: EAL domain-containing protein [Pseudomonadota bacterium]
MQDKQFTDEELLELLKKGIEKDYIAPWFQPVMDPSGTIMHSAEALPRFIDPEFGVISPMTFLDVAFKHRLLGPIGEVLLLKTCEAHAIWQEREIAPGLVTINLSSLELQTDGIVDRIRLALDKAGIEGKNLGVEVVEATAYEDGCEKSLKAIDDFVAFGVKIIVDDVGSGETQIENLQRLHASAAKIDRMTVSVLGEDDAALVRVKTLAEACKKAEIPLIAKGVETRLQINTLVEVGCEGQQGFAIARPMPLDSFTEWLDLNTGWDTSDAA